MAFFTYGEPRDHLAGPCCAEYCLWGGPRGRGVWGRDRESRPVGAVMSRGDNMATNDDLKRAAWLMASQVLGYDPAYLRRDAFGWYIVWSEYGDRNSVYGWEIHNYILDTTSPKG